MSSTPTRGTERPLEFAPSSRIWTWVPALVLAVGALVGIALWDRWGLLISLERVVRYCF